MNKKLIHDTVFMLLGGFLYAFATCFFIFPSSIILGGTSGISVMLNFFIPFSAGSIITAINILLMILAFFILGKASASKTFVGSIITTLAIKLFDIFFVFSEPPVSNPYISSIIGASLIAIATAMLLYVDSSSGGTDIIALIINKFSKMNIGTSLLVSDILIVIIGGVLSGLTVAISSIIGLVIKALGANLFLYIAVETKRRRVLKNHEKAK
ncbi:MAG: YitT family protein [Ruminococcaceae bacterium]|nr:YitT family protein [Oscillospiraceae bacterium]